MICATISRSSSRERPQDSGFQPGRDFGGKGREADGVTRLVFLCSYRVVFFISVQWRAGFRAARKAAGRNAGGSMPPSGTQLSKEWKVGHACRGEASRITRFDAGFLMTYCGRLMSRKQWRQRRAAPPRRSAGRLASAAITVLFAAYLAIDDLGIAALASLPADRRGGAALRCRHCFRLIKRPQ